jgi:glycosyltransferase involved in cell wall biosynthesis
MIVVIVVLALYAAVSLLYWLRTAYCAFRTMRDVPSLSKLQPPAPQTWPKLSVVVPACNEADKIEPALRSILTADYPHLQVVVVDDRSTDGTGRIIDRIAGEDPRVTPIRVADLPDGWLGKPHALHRGLAAADGEFVLFTDADVHFRPDTFRRAVGRCLDRGLDYLTAFPQVWPTHIWLDALIASFGRQNLILGARPWLLGNPKSKAFLGIGAFNLVRRSAFEATEGFEWLRMEVADDAGLGLMMKRSGARCELVAAFEHVGLHWYRTIGEAARGAEKGCAVAGFSLTRTLVMGVVMLLLELAPVLTLLPLAWEPTRWIGYAGIAVFALFVASAVFVRLWGIGRMAAGLLTPLVAPLIAVLFVRMAIVGKRRGGIVWRGTLYPKAALLAGRRVQFGGVGIKGAAVERVGGRTAGE